MEKSSVNQNGCYFTYLKLNENKNTQTENKKSVSRSIKNKKK